MPCMDSNPHPDELRYDALKKLLREVGLTPSSYNGWGKRALDLDTAQLCAWCKAHDVSVQSLELQIWWRDHQAADALREAAEAKVRRRAELRASAISKLTPEEVEEFFGKR